MIASIDRVVSAARIHAPDELRQLPLLACVLGIAMLALAGAWVALP